MRTMLLLIVLVILDNYNLLLYSSNSLIRGLIEKQTDDRPMTI